MFIDIDKFRGMRSPYYLSLYGTKNEKTNFQFQKAPKIHIIQSIITQRFSVSIS